MSHVPRIAISGSQTINKGDVAGSKSVQAMVELIRRCGGEPVVINHLRNPEPPTNFDGIVLMGNDYDINPEKYGARLDKQHTHCEDDRHARLPDRPKRSEAEFQLARSRAKYEWQAVADAERFHIPIFGVCGGMQRINVGLKGELTQHADGLNAAHGKTDIDHSAPVRTVSILHDSHLYHLSERAGLLDVTNVDENDNRFGINSFHHQYVRPSHYGRGLRAAAVMQDKHEDGTGRMIIEAIEGEPPKPGEKPWFVLGVQWHPEFMPETKLSQAMLTRFVEHAREHERPNVITHVALVDHGRTHIDALGLF